MKRSSGYRISIWLVTGLLISSLVCVSGCGIRLPFGPGSGTSAEEAVEVNDVDALPPGIDDGEADDYVNGGSAGPSGASQTTAGDEDSEENAAEDSESEESAESASDAETGGFYYLNACDSQLGTEPRLDASDAETVYVSAVQVNVRADSDMDSEIIGTARRGMSLLRYEKSGDWSYVRYAGRMAYVWSEYLSDTKPLTVISSHDQDDDGIDDQTEILMNARAYVATHPIYESRYYDSGYPDDGYGVCSDIIAFAMRDAGYDLRELLAADIAANPAAYPDIKEPDSKIDFRRVVNLLTYFERHYVPKTTDLTQLDEWQGGDIIFFDHHIAVVSDRRNAEGIPYIIHHRSKFQIDYEEDYLGIRSDIIAHFRVSE